MTGGTSKPLGTAEHKARLTKGLLSDRPHHFSVVGRTRHAMLNYQGLHILVTAGPTREYIDPVRFLSNPSTGQMGYAIAEAAVRRGAHVTLVTGPTSLEKPKGVKVIDVVSAKEMYHATLKKFSKSNIIFKVAAVSDYRPQKLKCQKIKKNLKKKMALMLAPTRDILATLGKKKRRQQFLVGFAAETTRVSTHARQKLKQKKLDLIVANDVSRKGSGFAAKHNQVIVIAADGSTKKWPRLTKKQLAERLLTLTLKAYQKKLALLR